MARTVCRRAERVVLALCREDAPEQPVTESMKNILVFLNRLSDYLFVLARELNRRHGIKETVWNRDHEIHHPTDPPQVAVGHHL
jgi:cob(I)alamin adenosyltransferase